MLVGYARISTQDQNLDLQRDALEQAGCEKTFTDLSSGAQTERAGLNEALAYCRPSDTLVVWKLDRLGRSLPHLIETVQELQKRGIGFKSLQESIDTTTRGGNRVFPVFAALAEFERDLIRERTRAGLAAARARGRQGGRPRARTEAQAQRARTLRMDPQRTVKEICQTLQISEATFYRYTGRQASNDPLPEGLKGGVLRVERGGLPERGP